MIMKLVSKAHSLGACIIFVGSKSHESQLQQITLKFEIAGIASFSTSNIYVIYFLGCIAVRGFIGSLCST